MDLVEEVGESSSPPRGYGDFGSGGGGNDAYNRLVESGKWEAISNPDFREQLEAHFNRLPPSYGLDINIDRVEDVLLHQKLLEMAKDSVDKPVFHIRFLEEDSNEDYINFGHARGAKEGNRRANDGVLLLRNYELTVQCENNVSTRADLDDVQMSKMLETSYPKDTSNRAASLNERQEAMYAPTHEVIFSTFDKPKLLSQLSALLSDIGLNIREAHVYSTTDGFSLAVFVVDGWHTEDTEGLYDAITKALVGNEVSWSASTHSRQIVEKSDVAETQYEGWEIDWSLLKIGEKVAGGSCGDLYRGVYLGQDVAIKVLRSEHLNSSLGVEFAQEVAILRQVQHENIVRFIGACKKAPNLCIVTEYMPGGSLYEYLHKHHSVLKLPQLLRFAIDVCKGMEYLHQKNIVHRDLKTANLLVDAFHVVKVADFGVSRFQNNGGIMTAETGTYRWMAPEVINHQPYDQKADVFSFAIVLWEFVTSKVPYDTMTPLQAALGVRQGLRPELPRNANPKLVDLMQRCWEALPNNRPSFSEIRNELEQLLHEVYETPDPPNGC